MEKTLGSLFDGIGGFPLAASRHGIKTIWASEIEPFPIKVTKIRLPDMQHLGDITKIDGTNIEPVDIVTFGSPCQDLSVAGKRAGLAGKRSGLFMEAIRIIKEMRSTYEETSQPIRPRFAVWENVPGAFSSNKGQDFKAVIEEICRVKDETVVIPRPPKGKWSTVGAIMGNGWSVAWRVLDAQYWGVPQRRRRIFLVADFGGQSAPEILFKRKGLSRHIAESGDKRKRTAPNAERSVDETSDCLTPWDVQGRRVHKASGKWPALYGGEGGGRGYVAIPTVFNEEAITSKTNASNPQPGDPCHTLGATGAGRTIVLNDQGGSQMDVSENVVGTLRAEMHGNIPAVVNNGFRMTAFGEYADDDSASTVKMRDYKDATDLVVGVDAYNHKTTGDKACSLAASSGSSATHSGPMVSQRYSVRRLTPLECERLQGFPDGWTDIPGQTEATEQELEFWRDVWLTWDKTQAENPEEVKPRTDKRLLRWLKNPTSDSGRYKALGNSVAIPCVEYVLEGISEILDREQRS